MSGIAQAEDYTMDLPEISNQELQNFMHDRVQAGINSVRRMYYGRHDWSEDDADVFERTKHTTAMFATALDLLDGVFGQPPLTRDDVDDEFLSIIRNVHPLLCPE